MSTAAPDDPQRNREIPAVRAQLRALAEENARRALHHLGRNTELADVDARACLQAAIVAVETLDRHPTKG